MSAEVSPPTRGWTCSLPCQLRSPLGFPAHAGMDPCAISASHRSSGFPRPRGDGPASHLFRLDHLTVSPPTRGWTPHPTPGTDRGGGFPAHAGMDLRRGGRKMPVGGFPRPRGDGPDSDTGPSPRAWVSPPTRGWTGLGLRQRCAVRGFPAHAGMDPMLMTRAMRSAGFPRPRGDGPTLSSYRRYRAVVSPPTRGWTRRHGKQRSYTDGFPAHAGMDLEPAAQDASTRRVSPPTRGWTYMRLTAILRFYGFPAHAGDGPRGGCPPRR